MKKATQSKSKGSPAKKSGKSTKRKAKEAVDAAAAETQQPEVVAEAEVATVAVEPAIEAEPSAPAATKAMSCLDAAVAVLKAKGEPMRCKEMIAAMAEQDLWHSTAPTPHATLYSAILREITVKGAESRFKKTDRGHFTLNA